MIHKKSLVVSAILLLGFSASTGAQESWQPQGNIEFLVGAGPGGENDRIARAIQQALEDEGLVDTMAVLNRPGAGQIIAMTELARRNGNANTIGLASGSFINAIARSGSRLHDEVTPLIKLFDAYQAFFTSTDSPIESMTDIRDMLATDPASIAFAFPVGLGSPLHVAAVQVAQTAGVQAGDVKAVVFDSGTDVATQVGGGHAEVGITSIGSAMPLVTAGQIRFLGIASPERMGGAMADVPTLKEQGLDLIIANSYTVLTPDGLTDEQIQFWAGAMDTVLENGLFQENLERNFWVAQPVVYPDSVTEFQNAYDETREILEEIGLAE